MASFLGCWQHFCSFWRNLPFGTAIAMVLSWIAWRKAHVKVDDVIDGLYAEWGGAADMREKIALLDFPFGIVVAVNCAATLLSLCAGSKIRRALFSLGEDEEGGEHDEACVKCCMGSMGFGIMSILIMCTVLTSVIASYGLLCVWMILKVLTVLCRLPWGLLPMVDDIIDQVDHPLTAGLDLVKFCPDHGSIDKDALELFFGSLMLALGQAGMLACIHSSNESLHFTFFDRTDKQRPTNMDSDSENADQDDSDYATSNRELIMSARDSSAATKSSYATPQRGGGGGARDIVAPSPSPPRLVSRLGQDFTRLHESKTSLAQEGIAVQTASSPI